MADYDWLRKLVYKIGFGFLIMAAATNLMSQEKNDLKEMLFAETDKLLAQVQAEQASVLSPSNYKEAKNKYDQASKEFREGKQIKEIQKKLSEVRTLLQKSLDVAKLGHITFETTLEAREDALKANAPEHAKEAYDKAENEFIDAAKKLERGDVRGAKKEVPQINDLFRRAELSAIKTSIMGNVRNLMKEAKDIEADKYTPITYANAQKLLNEAEAILNSNRRSEASAQEKAEAAEFEAKHAIALTRQIKWLKKNEKEWENFILDREVLVEQIARELGFDPTFEEGMKKPLRRILEISKILQNEKKELLREEDEKNAEIQRLQEELQNYREKEQGLQAELQEKQYRLAMKKRREETIRSIENLFSSEEAVVLQKGNDIILRLIGLTFPSGKSTIEPEFFSLLAKVQRAIRKFPNAPLSIEGHTDSVGDDRFNENLSYERAQAVKKYLMANMGIDESRITALGYGESRPIASNETSQGRAQNRRIDIVITFTQETL